MVFVVLGFFALFGFFVSYQLKRKVAQYGQFPISNGMTGSEISRMMLRHYQINDVAVVEGRGFLTDHYNPQTKTITLSPGIFNGNSISSASVAAHECGHAVQHAASYGMLKLRTSLVPLVQISSKLQQLLFFGAIFAGGLNNGNISNIVMMILLTTFGLTALFSLVTLPVEFDASNRALAWIKDANIVRGSEFEGSKDALRWAAMTYVVQALSSMAMFVYFFWSIFNNKK